MQQQPLTIMDYKKCKSKLALKLKICEILQQRCASFSAHIVCQYLQKWQQKLSIAVNFQLVRFLNARCNIAIIFARQERWKLACQQPTENCNNKNTSGGIRALSYNPHGCFHCRLHIDFDRLICCLSLIESASLEMLVGKQQQYQHTHTHTQLYGCKQLHGCHWRAIGKFVFPKREISIDTRGQCQQHT